MRFHALAAVLLIVIVLGSAAIGCVSKSSVIGGVPVADYLAVAPRTLHAGEETAVAFTLLSADGQLVRDKVAVTLLSAGKAVLQTEGEIKGKGEIALRLPENLAEGNYELRVKGSHFEDKASVQVKRSLLLFLETDKPIYKPGQTIHIRALTLKSDLRPASQTLSVEVLDAKGIKIFRKEVTTDDFGMAALDLPLSTEPNLGVWKIKAQAVGSETELDVRVEEYVLPKYQVTIELPRDWYLAGEQIEGTVKAEYTFGKPVEGEIEISASRYVGKWEEYATFRKAISGETSFELPAVGYVSGVPEARGMGNVILEARVIEESTGYEEKTSRMLTIAENPLSIQIIPEGMVFKPGLPFDFLIVTESPDNRPAEAEVELIIRYVDKEFNEFKTEERSVETKGGKAILSLSPPEKAAAIQVEASAEGASAWKAVEAGYSPSGNFIHVEQTSEGIPSLGQEIAFRVYSTREAANFYYEVVSRDRVVFTGFTRSDEIRFAVTPQMAPSAKILVYQILPTSEVAADYLPFSIAADYPHNVSAGFSEDEAAPGDAVTINVSTEGQAKVGLVAVDKSVFILAENRLNLAQIFAELERLYMEPQAELHEVSIYEEILLRGASEIFEDAGVVVMSSAKVPEGEKYQQPWRRWGEEALKGGIVMFDAAEGVAVPSVAPTPTPAPAQGEGLAEVQRVRQFFPETWLWQEVITGSNGKGSVEVTVPDSITTWMLRAVALSKEKGLGIAEAQLRVFQPFFLTVDLPYSCIRGEEFPVKVALYNYLDEPQDVSVEIAGADWFELLDEPQKSVRIAAGDIGGVEFRIRPTLLGLANEVKITARSKQAADAVIKKVIVEPESVAREEIENLTLSAGSRRTVDTSLPVLIVEGSGRAYLAVTGSFLAQTIDGLDQLLQMPFGCGEQNMIVFAPDVFITKYLQESGQLKPEIMAKAEKLMITGYQRELTYRHTDGSFSAFGESDESGSLWLTAFVLKSFAQARELIYIDQTILDEATRWIVSHQNKDGSFESVGFVHHQEMLGGVQGKDALTAYVAIALMEAGESAASARAVNYLEGQLEGMDDPYAVAITAYALELAGSGLRDTAYEKLMSMAKEDENGLHWGEEAVPLKESRMMEWMPMPQSTVIENTGYAVLALIRHGDAFNASRAAKWLTSQRNAYGGYGSTQDTVVALQALTEYAADARSDVDLDVTVIAEGDETKLSINEDNFDVLQIVSVPVNAEITIEAEGKGEAIAQAVIRYNEPKVETAAEPILSVEVDYDAAEVEVNDLVTVSARVTFNPPMPMQAGMVVVDISVPTGFAPVRDTVEAAVERDEKIKRYEIAGRKVIFYIEDMAPGEEIRFSFQVQAQYPVKAKGTTSVAYSYYNPEIKGESLSAGIVVTD